MKFMIYTLITVLLLIAAIYLFTDRFIFFPAVSTYQDSKQILKLKTKGGDIISAVYLHPEKKVKYIVLMSHGNAEDIGSLYSIFHEWLYRDFSVLAYDYPGYGTSEGIATEKSVYQSAETAYNYLTKALDIPANRIIIYGRSIGAAVAIQLATLHPAAGLILEAPFISAFRVVTKFPLLPFDKYNNLKKIKKIHCPVLVVHGTQDEVIPFWHGKRIYRAANEPKDYLWVDGAGHNDILQVANDAYWGKIKQFIQSKIAKNK
ncbi:MAG: alpha/beta hydrolase [Gammaproteobacteria bacterium]|nr:alpha/beta hydrolase [Gammaproteobacteria bacterium]